MKRKQDSVYRSLFTLALPLFGESLLSSLMGTVNTYMMSNISDDASAAVGIGSQILNLVLLPRNMLAAGALILLNQALGAKDREKESEITSVSISMTFIAGIIVSIILWFFAEAFTRALGLQEALIPDARAYVRTYGVCAVIPFLFSTIAQMFRSRKRTGIPMVAIAAANVVNIIGSLLVVKGGLFGSSVAGLAAVRVFSEAVSLGILIFVMIRSRWDIRPAYMKRFRGPVAKNILKLGFMAGLEGLTWSFAILISTRFITDLPSYCLSAKVYAQTINVYPHMFGTALGQSAQILMGYYIGRGEEKEAFAFSKKLWWIIFAFNVPLTLLMCALTAPLVRIFTDSEEIISLCTSLFLIDLGKNFGRCFNFTFNNGLKSAGHVLPAMISSNTSVIVLEIGLAWLLTRVFHLGLVGLWISQTADELARAVFYSIFWFRKRWMKKAV